MKEYNKRNRNNEPKIEDTVTNVVRQEQLVNTKDESGRR